MDLWWSQKIQRKIRLLISWSCNGIIWKAFSIQYKYKTKEDVEFIDKYNIRGDGVIISFEEIKKAFLDNFDCKIVNRTVDLEVRFKYENDADWFDSNICYPKDLEKDEYPIEFLSSLSPIGDLKYASPYSYIFNFRVKDGAKLIKMLNTRK